MTNDQTGPGAVDAYLAGVAGVQRATLDSVRMSLRTLLPDADECLKYGMPAFAVRGKGVAGYGAFAKHCGYFPMSGTVIEQAGDAVAGYTVSKGGLQFPVDQPLPMDLLRTLVELRLAELGDPPDRGPSTRGRSRSR